MNSGTRFQFVKKDVMNDIEVLLNALNYRQTQDRTVDNKPARDMLIFDTLHKRYWKLDFKCFENNALHIQERYKEELTEYKDERVTKTKKQ